MISSTSTTVPASSRPRLPAPPADAAADTVWVATTHVTTARSAHGTATIAASGERSHRTTDDTAARVVTIPGMPEIPVAARASMTWAGRSGNGASLAASTVESRPARRSGPRSQPSRSREPARTATAAITSRGWVSPRTTMPTTARARKVSAHRTPKQNPTSCHGRRMRLLARMRYRSLRTVATTPAPVSCGDLRRAIRTCPAGTRPRARRRPCRPPARGPPRSRRCGRTCAGRDPSSGSRR